MNNSISATYRHKRTGLVASPTTDKPNHHIINNISIHGLEYIPTWVVLQGDDWEKYTVPLSKEDNIDSILMDLFITMSVVNDENFESVKLKVKDKFNITYI